MGKKYLGIQTFSHATKFAVDCQQVVTVNDKRLIYVICAVEIKETLLG